jgi:hypothetical protein
MSENTAGPNTAPLARRRSSYTPNQGAVCSASGFFDDLPTNTNPFLHPDLAPGTPYGAARTSSVPRHP